MAVGSKLIDNGSNSVYRETVMGTVSECPGITIAELPRAITVGGKHPSRNAVTYHLHVLESEELLVLKKIGKRTYCFPNGIHYSRGQWEGIATICSMNAEGIALLKVVADGHPEPIESVKGVIGRANETGFAVEEPMGYYYMTKWKEAGLIKTEGKGQRKLVSLDVEATKAYAPVLLRVARREGVELDLGKFNPQASFEEAMDEVPVVQA